MFDLLFANLVNNLFGVIRSLILILFILYSIYLEEKEELESESTDHNHFPILEDFPDIRAVQILWIFHYFAVYGLCEYNICVFVSTTVVVLFQSFQKLSSSNLCSTKLQI